MKRGNHIASIYNLYANDLLSYGIYLGFNREVVKDAIHDIFVKLTIESDRVENITNIKFYLFKSLKNRLLDLHKNKKEHIEINSFDYTQTIPFNIHVNVEELMIEREEQLQIKNEIAQMLNSLTDRQREIIYLRYVQEYDYQQISELLHISVHGCRKLVSKAILSLKDQYKTLILLFVVLS